MDALGIFLTIAGFVIGLGAVTVIDLHGFLGRNSLLEDDSSSDTVQPPAPSEEEETSDSCDIKGNISSEQEKIYHVPGCGSYNQTKIDESAGERWFCSEQEAIDAGWRRAENCD